MKNLHWDFIASDKQEKDGRFLKASRVSVIDAQTEREALKKAKKILKRKIYWLEKVGEYESSEINKTNQKLLEQMIKKL
jgi:hypothetical protein